jgi:hypothetical protein
MDLFKSFTLKWWQGGLFKLSMISLGIILGVYFQTFFLKWIVIVTIIFIVPAIYLFRLWWRQ